ncbi:hypothetical protein N7495_008128 [Penicillium taxi]|uniref:uncharacterized protein n=1 Tax=Penicillium taxi TaxID=168475 RepID=UPI0025452695|nr:uncharacterized protein N7495_008128 [Penicillium taxi]KAJ5888087.1 hypothetical protein N7495_008128 [Penicillium taxi]
MKESLSLCQTLKEHGDSVSLISWSPCGTRLALATDDKTVKIWDPATGQSSRYQLDCMVARWNPTRINLGYGIRPPARRHNSWVRSIAWSPDGTRLALVSTDNTRVKIWELDRDSDTCQSVSTLKGHKFWVSSIDWSPDGNRLASASYDNTVIIWDMVTYQDYPPSRDIMMRSGQSPGHQMEPDSHQRFWIAHEDAAVPPISLKSLENRLSGTDKEYFLHFLSSMLKWLLEERRTARQLLDDPWLL